MIGLYLCVLGGEIYDKIYTIFCTGFRPILDAMKSFAKDENPIDIEVCFQYHHINFRNVPKLCCIFNCETGKSFMKKTKETAHI